MPFSETISAAQTAMQKLHDLLDALRILVELDQPATGRVELSEYFEMQVQQLMAWHAEAYAACVDAKSCAEHRSWDQDALRRNLAVCRRCVVNIGRTLACDLESPDRLDELMAMGTKRGGGWRLWTGSVRSSLAAARAPVWDACEAVFTCWHELAERLACVPAAGGRNEIWKGKEA